MRHLSEDLSDNALTKFLQQFEKIYREIINRTQSKLSKANPKANKDLPPVVDLHGHIRNPYVCKFPVEKNLCFPHFGFCYLTMFIQSSLS